MSSRPPVSGASRASFLELLEPRIAPAGIVMGPQSLGGSQYFYPPPPDPDPQPDPPPPPPPTPFKPAAAACPDVGFSPNHYFLDLIAKNKDVSSVSAVSVEGNTIDFIKLSGGSSAAYAFFYDVPDPLTGKGDGIPTVNELTGLSLAAGTSIAVKGNIDGDVVANRDPQGNLVAGSLISDRQTIAAFSASVVGTNNGADGKIIAGGNLSNISVGKVKVIQSGTPDYGSPDQRTYNFGGTASAIGTLQPFDPGVRRAGGNLVNITAASVDYILAGPGGPGGVGGNISNVLVSADADGVLVRAGDGGDDARGGRGGSVNQVVLSGAQNAVANAPLQVLGGDGGGISGGSNGGAGGGVSNVWLGYEYSSTARKSVVESVYAVKGNVLVEGGDGGAGIVAGVGGSLRGINVFADTPDQPGVAYEIIVRGGDGGEIPAAARTAGAGGAVSLVKVKNVDLGMGLPNDRNYSDVLIAGGDASTADGLAPGSLPTGRGAAGGSVSNPVAKPGEQWLIGASFSVEGGRGSDAQSAGGKGGAVTNLSFQPFSSLYLRDLSIEGGAGGTAATGPGGAGGTISGLAVPAGDLRLFSLAAGTGGPSVSGGVGGPGGSISKLDVFDFDPSNPEKITTLVAKIEAGNGGDGFRGGGVGGALQNLSLFSTAASLQAVAGNGGSAIGSVRANGGAGGAVSGLAFLSERSTNVLAPTETLILRAGLGGDARGTGGGGAGGALSRINVEVPGEISIRSGDGGKAEAGGRTGAGGIVGGPRIENGLAAATTFRSVELTAGSAGGGPAAVGGSGGSVINAVFSAPRNITVVAGEGADGNSGGAGGSLTTIGFYGQVVATAPQGDVLLRAGNGGDASTGRSGAGGSITKSAGFTSNALANLQEVPPNFLRLVAGDGGSGGSIGGIGGSVDGLSLLDGYAPFSVVAGHGGDGRTGGAGGSLANIASAVKGVAYALAAGDGGDGSGGRAGLGGSVNRVDVIGDIGIRAEKEYGFAVDGTKMGGIFAGRGGLSGSVEATAGRVTNVTAQAISSIVAGRGDSPYLVSLVDAVYLRGNEAASGVGTALPNLVEHDVTTQGNGAAGAVLGSGAKLAFTGFYDGRLNVELTTAGGVFDGITVIYIDADGNASGIRDTQTLLRSPILPVPSNADVLVRAVAGQSFNSANPLDWNTAFQSVLDFDIGFRPEYALAFTNNQAVLYGLAPSTITPLTAVLPVATAGNVSTFDLLLRDLELSSTTASSFNFAASYLAGPSQITPLVPVPPNPPLNPPLVELPGAFRTNQSVGFSISGADPGSGITFSIRPGVSTTLPGIPTTLPDSDFVVPVTRVSSYITFTQALANFVGGKSTDPLSLGAQSFQAIGATFQPNAQAPATTDWVYGTTKPLDGLVAATTLTAKRNFMPLAFLTNASGGSAELYLPTIPAAK